MKKKYYYFLLSFLILTADFFSQNDYQKQFITVKPGAQYEAGWLHKLFFGSHWRDLWTTDLKVEVLNLDKFAGGLTPVEKGGGLQTKSLRFKGKDGRIWKFRTINKDPKKVLPPELQESIVAEIIQDQISTSNPLAPLVVAPFLDATGILQSKPTIVLMPDDEKLGEFRSEFAGLLGMIEIHPEEAEEDNPGFAEAEKISGTFKLFETLEKKREQKVDAAEFLKARLIDIFLGDWDRHTDQWRWARFNDNGKFWHPIPRDRDQAFSKYDGLFPSIASYFVPQLTNFGYNYPQVEDITWNGRYLDRRFLTEIDKHTWDSVTSFVHSKLSDELIEYAVNQLPGEFYKKAGGELISKLKSRRDHIFEFSRMYYEFVNDIVDIFCSEKDDYVEINRLSDEETEVAVFKFDKETGGEKDEFLYHKVFDNNITSEFRINLSDGDDKVVVNGTADRSPLIRITGGEGQDVLEDNSVVNGYFLFFTPISDAENKTIMYDDGKDTKIKYGPGTCWNNDPYPQPKDEIEKYEPPLRDRGSDWIAKPVIGYNSDDGILFGGGFLLNSYNFRAEPLEYQMDFTAAYATNPSSYLIAYKGDFYTLIKGGVVNLDFFMSGLSLINYFGFGNETRYDKDLEDSGFYRLERELLNIHPSIRFSLFDGLSVGFGAAYNYSETTLKNDTLLYNLSDPDYGLNSFKLLGINSFVEFDKRDNISNPYEGYYLNLSGYHYPGMLDNKYPFTRTGFDARAYFTTNFITDLTFAFRAGGEKLFGSYPFFKAAFLGGEQNLRGYNRERFSGDASLFGQAEMRFYVTDTKLILKGRSGFHIFAETGRVFTGKYKSNKWHPSYGGGLWISYLDRTLNLNFTIAGSEETLIFYFLTRFMF